MKHLRLLVFFFLSALQPFSPSAFSQTPLSGLPVANPTRDAKVVGHTPAGAAKQFTVGSLVDVYNVKHYGATGNGTTDDTTAIAAALAAAPAGATILFPAGTYRTTSALTISAAINVVGYGATLKSAAYNDGTKIAIASSGITIRGLTIDGGYTSGLSGYTGPGLITINNSSNTALSDIQILDCTIKNASFVGIAPQDNVVRVRIKDCLFTNNWCSIYFGTTIGGTWPSNTDCEVIGCRFYNNWGTGSQSGACKVQGDYTRTVGPTRFVFDNNIIDNPGEMGIEIWKNGLHCSVRNNIIYNAVYSVSIDGSSFCIAENNSIYNFSYSGFEIVQGSNHCLISGNVINGYIPGTTTRGPSGQRGIISSGTATFNNKFIGNTIVGCQSAGIELQVSNWCQIESNTIKDCDTCIVPKWGNYHRIIGNTLIGPVSQFIFIDYNNGSGTDVVIEGNIFRGEASSDGITIYDNSHGNTLSNIRISNNDTTTATYGNTGANAINNLMANTPNLQIYGNRYTHNGSTGSIKFIDYANDLAVAMQYDRVFQAGGISVAGKTVVQIPISTSARWVKIWSGLWGSPIALQIYVNAYASDYIKQNSFLCSVVVSPYGTSPSVTFSPQTNYNQGIVEEVIANSPGASALEVWIKIKATTTTATMECSLSEKKEFIQTAPTLLTTEPTWGTSAHGYLKDFQQDSFTPPRLYATKSISSYNPTSAWIGTGGRLHIRGVGSEGSPSDSRIARFDIDDGTEVVGVDETGKLMVKAGMTIGGQNIRSVLSNATDALNFGTITANSSTSATMPVPGITTANAPLVFIGWGSAFPSGIVQGQAYVSADDQVTITLNNVTGSSIAVGTLPVRVSVMTQY